MLTLQLYPHRSSPCCVDTQILKNQKFSVSPQSYYLRPHTSSISKDTFSNVITSIRTCIYNRDLQAGSYIHAKILKFGIDSDIFIGNSLIDMYSKCGHIEDATELFENMPHRTVVSWTSMMSGYNQDGLFDKAKSLFQQMLEILQPNEFTLAVVLQACNLKLVRVVHCYMLKCGFLNDNFLQNSLIDTYARNGELADSYKLLERFSGRDVVSWTSIISGCVHNGMVEKALVLFFQMQEDGVMPNEVTILSVLQACLSMNEWHVFRWIHGLVMKFEWCRNAFVMNSLVVMYSANGYFAEGIKIFCKFCFNGEDQYLSPETMTSFLQGCANSGSLELGKEIHGYLAKHGFFPCTIVENSLVDMYGKNGKHGFALQVYTKMSNKDIISWNTVIKSFVKNEQPSEALNLLSEIHSNGGRFNIYPDFITMLTSIQACADLAALWQGQVIHGYAAKTGLNCDIFVQNALIDMYGKSGRLDFAEKFFQEMGVKDLGTWNSMIRACGMNGNGKSALQMFKEMKKSANFHPNEITFVNILSACAHARLVIEGFEIFNSMKRDYGIEPKMEHFVSMVDLLGRSGRLEEAEAFIEKMPIKPGPDLWVALLGACALFGNVEIAERVANELSVLEPQAQSSVWRVVMSNIYASVGRWEKAIEVREGMEGLEEERRKEGGWSSVEVRGDMCRFMVADSGHPQSRMIYEVLSTLQQHIRDSYAVA